MYPYAFTKWQAEELIMHWVKIYNFPAISFRLFNVYGPRSQNSGSYSAVINIFMKQKFLKKPFTVVGDGSQTRSFIHVYDVVDAILKSLTNKESEYALKLSLSGNAIALGATVLCHENSGSLYSKFSKTGYSKNPKMSLGK